MERIRVNFRGGQIADAPLTDVAVDINSSNLSDLPVISSPDILVIVLDPDGLNGAPEIVWVTNHTSLADFATISRGQEGSAAREHPAGTYWIHAPTVQDFIVEDLFDDLATELMNTITGTVVLKSGSVSTGEQEIPTVKITGKNGLFPRIFDGRKTTAGAPTSGTWLIDDEVIDSDGMTWRCTVSGTPGTWVNPLATYIAAAIAASSPVATYVAYTPADVGITVGNGIRVARYSLSGKRCSVRWSLILGSTSILTSCAIGLPFVAASGIQNGGANYLDSGTRHYSGACYVDASAGAIATLLHTESGGTGAVTATAPFVFTTNDRIIVSLDYEIA